MIILFTLCYYSLQHWINLFVAMCGQMQTKTSTTNVQYLTDHAPDLAIGKASLSVALVYIPLFHFKTGTNYFSDT